MSGTAGGSIHRPAIRLPAARPAMNTVKTALTENTVLPMTTVNRRVHTTS
jgi:hypothetical protein